MVTRGAGALGSMVNASADTARFGYTLFRILHASGVVLTLDAINAELAKAHREPIHQRTLSHYYKLYEAGQEEYITINRWDVLNAG